MAGSGRLRSSRRLVTGAGDQKKIDDQDRNKNQRTHDYMKWLESQNTLLARRIEGRNMTLSVVVTVIRLGHKFRDGTGTPL